MRHQRVARPHWFHSAVEQTVLIITLIAVVRSTIATSPAITAGCSSGSDFRPTGMHYSAISAAVFAEAARFHL